jgi:Txe/YoeB family toxin of toxin-antitoxin system
MVNYTLAFTTRARRDAKKIANSELQGKAQQLFDVLTVNPYQNPPPYEKLVGDLRGCYSRRINIHNRLVYEVLESEKIVRILAMWTHYE